MFKFFTYATHLPYVNGYYQIIIVDSQLGEKVLPLNESHFDDWDYNQVYSASAYAFYKKHNMNGIKNYCKFLRQIYTDVVSPETLKLHTVALSSMFPEYSRDVYPCLHREFYGE